MQKLKKTIKYNILRKNEDGVTVVEFALIAPVLFMFIFGIIELSLVMYVQSVIEGATTLTSRLGKTGYVDGGQSRETTLMNALQSRAGIFLDPSHVTITSKFYGQFDQIGDEEPYIDTDHDGHRDSNETYTDVNGNGQWDADMAAQGYGDANDIVVYTVSYPWQINTPFVSRLVGDDGLVTLSAVAVVKNEPY